MHAIIIQVLVTVFSLNPLRAAQPPAESLLREMPKGLSADASLILTPRDGYHFNLAAPQKCEGGIWEKKSAQELICRPKAPGFLKVKVAICDEAQSFCKIESFQVLVQAISSPSGKKISPQKESPEEGVQKMELPAPHGFLANVPDQAVKQATRENKLLLIDFYGIWCPPCNYLDEFVFDRPEFVQATSNFVKIRLDADSEVSWAWKEKFKIGGYPTLVIADSKLREVGRLVGSRPLGPLVSWIKEQEALKEVPLDVALKNPEKNLLRIANGLFDRGELQKAKKYYLQHLNTQHGQDSFARMRVFLCDLDEIKEKLNKAGKKESALLNERLRKTYETLLKSFAGEIEAVDWLSAFYELDSKKAAAYLNETRKTLEKWRGSEKLGAQGYTPGDLFQSEAALLDQFGEKELARETYFKAAQYYAEEAKNSKLALSRAANSERAYCLLNADRVEEAKGLYEKLVQAYPNEFTYHYYYGRALQKLKDFEKALGSAEKAVAFGYGDNRLRALSLQTELAIALGKKEPLLAAIRIGKETLAKTKLPRSKENRTHRYREGLKKQLGAAEKKLKEI